MGEHPSRAKSSVCVANPPSECQSKGNNFIRILPPASAEGYAHDHDESIWSTARKILVDPPGSKAKRDRARLLASLPMRSGGSGLRFAV